MWTRGVVDSLCRTCRLKPEHHRCSTMNNNDLRQVYREILEKLLFAEMLGCTPDQADYHRTLGRAIANIRIAAAGCYLGFNPEAYLSLDILIQHAVEAKITDLMTDDSQESSTDDLTNLLFGRECWTPFGIEVDDQKPDAGRNKERTPGKAWAPYRRGRRWRTCGFTDSP